MILAQVIHTCQDTTQAMLPFDQHPFLASTLVLMALLVALLAAFPLALVLNGRRYMRALEKLRDGRDAS